MRCAAHTHALKSVIEGRAHPLTGPMLMSAKIGLTQSILNEYSRELGRNPLFQAWFAAAQAGNRLVVKRPEDGTRRLNGLNGESLQYGVASYFSAGSLCATRHTSTLDYTALQSLGVSVFNVEDAPAINIPGDNPVLTISLATNGTADPSILDKFLLPEDEIIIYDKYISAEGLLLLSHVAARLSVGSTMHIRTTDLGGTCKRPAEILSRLHAVNPGIGVSCKLVSARFRKQAHDRYMFFGKRLQAVFTVGTDCFGRVTAAGKWQNRQSKINLYALDSTTPLKIEAEDGSLLLTPFMEAHHC